ncbi:YibE/F family protein, partial [Pseudomonas sp. 2822-17]|uniref:YibE/F family protein n=1 Tax=Pseudomonas sp. 2822-17 TaxID=1712678 RepID=UPI0034D33E54
MKADIVSHARDFPTYLLIGSFIALLLFFGKKKGLMSVITIGLTLFIIFKFMIPLLYNGYSPIFLAVVTGSIVTVVTFMMISGISK